MLGEELSEGSVLFAFSLPAFVSVSQVFNGSEVQFKLQQGAETT